MLAASCRKRRAIYIVAGWVGVFLRLTRAHGAHHANLGVRRSLDRRVSQSIGFEVFTDAVHLRPGKRFIRTRLSDAAHTVL